MHQNSLKKWRKNLIFKWKNIFGGKNFTNNWLMILFVNFWCFSKMIFDFPQWWGWVVWDSSQFFWSFDTHETPGSVSIVFADNQSENEILNRLKQFLPVWHGGRGALTPPPQICWPSAGSVSVHKSMHHYISMNISQSRNYMMHQIESYRFCIYFLYINYTYYVLDDTIT